MAIKFAKIKPEMTLFEKKRVKAGNTTVSYDIVYEVRVISVHTVEHPASSGMFGHTYPAWTERYAMVSWNGNAPEKWSARKLEKLYANAPKKLKKNPFAGW